MAHQPVRKRAITNPPARARSGSRRARSLYSHPWKMTETSHRTTATTAVRIARMISSTRRPRETSKRANWVDKADLLVPLARWLLYVLFGTPRDYHDPMSDTRLRDHLRSQLAGLKQTGLYKRERLIQTPQGP